MKYLTRSSRICWVINARYRMNTVWYHYETIDPHTEQYVSRSKYGFECGDFKGNVCNAWTFYDQKVFVGTSLVVQWLRLYIPNAGVPGLIPGRETRSHMLQLKTWLNKMLKKYLCINSVIRSTYLFTAGVTEVTKVVYAKYGLSETIHPEAYSEYIISSNIWSCSLHTLKLVQCSEGPGQRRWQRWGRSPQKFPATSTSAYWDSIHILSPDPTNLNSSLLF